MEELVGSLMIHELNTHLNEEEDELKKKKTITFKSTIKFEESIESEDENEKKSEDGDVGLPTRKFKRFLKNG